VCVVFPLVSGSFLCKIGLTRFSAIFARSSRVFIVIACVVSGGFCVVSAMISLCGAIICLCLFFVTLFVLFSL